MSQRRGGLNLSVKMDTLTNNTVTIPFTDNDGTTQDITNCNRVLDNVTEISEETLIELGGGYNKAVWLQNIASAKRDCTNVKFYRSVAFDRVLGYETDTFWCSYSTDGLNYFRSFSYSIGISNAPCMAVILHDGGAYTVPLLTFQKSTAGRSYMRTLSGYGWIFSSDL